MKQINLNKPIYDLWKEDPGIIDVMLELGFHDITKKGALNTAGRVMTLEKGARMKGITLDTIMEYFKRKGYIIQS
ncbi:MAG: DUF1858 domain-containing protein [Epulopiscium sp.]|nr:DUF1858 domain-containing protein [Candidatus Epulonipiscium sp.]